MASGIIKNVSSSSAFTAATGSTFVSGSASKQNNIVEVGCIFQLSSPNLGAWNELGSIPDGYYRTSRTTTIVAFNSTDGLPIEGRISIGGKISVYPTSYSVKGSGAKNFVFDFCFILS